MHYSWTRKEQKQDLKFSLTCLSMLNSLLYCEEPVRGYSAWLLLQILYMSEHAELKCRQGCTHSGSTWNTAGPLPKSFFLVYSWDPGPTASFAGGSHHCFLIWVTGFNNNPLLETWRAGKESVFAVSPVFRVAYIRVGVLCLLPLHLRHAGALRIYNSALSEIPT